MSKPDRIHSTWVENYNQFNESEFKTQKVPPVDGGHLIQMGKPSVSMKLILKGITSNTVTVTWRDLLRSRPFLGLIDSLPSRSIKYLLKTMNVTRNSSAVNTQVSAYYQNP